MRKILDALEKLFTRREFLTLIASTVPSILMAARKGPSPKLSVVSTNPDTGELVLSTVGSKAMPKTTLVQWIQEWGDGSQPVVGLGNPPTLLSHKYAASGSYTAALTLTDNTGAMGRYALTSSMIVNPPIPNTDTTGGGGSTGSGGGGGGLLPAITLADLTYLGAYRVPAPSAGDQIYGNALAIRYENSDATNPVHLISGTFNGSVGGRADYVYEWRDMTPENPVDPTNPALYGTATLMKEYGNIYRDGATPKRLVMYGSPAVPTEQTADNDGWISFYYDSVLSRLWWCYGDSYFGAQPGEDESWSFGYSTLNYSTGGHTAAGPWRVSTNKFKSAMTGITRIPDAFVTAASLGTKSMAVGFGGYGSLVAVGDASLGVSATAFTPPANGAPEQVTLTATKLIGYEPTVDTPGAGRDRQTRPSGYEFISQGRIPFDNWPTNKWTWGDRTQGGVWIHGTTKAGLVTFSDVCHGMPTYVSSNIYGERWFHAMSVVSEADMAAVAGGAPAYSIQPTTYDFQFGNVNQTAFPYAYEVRATITSITASAADQIDTTGALVTTSAAHGVSIGEAISVRGTNHASEYDTGWIVQSTPSSTQFRIYNPNSSEHWQGLTANTGSVRRVSSGTFASGGQGTGIRGVAYDSLTKKLYILQTHGVGFASMIAVYSVNC